MGTNDYQCPPSNLDPICVPGLVIVFSSPSVFFNYIVVWKIIHPLTLDNQKPLGQASPI